MSRLIEGMRNFLQKKFKISWKPRTLTYLWTEGVYTSPCQKITRLGWAEYDMHVGPWMRTVDRRPIPCHQSPLDETSVLCSHRRRYWSPSAALSKQSHIGTTTLQCKVPGREVDRKRACCHRTVPLFRPGRATRRHRMHDHAGVAVDEDPRVAWRVRTTTTVGLFRCPSISLASAVFFLLVTRWNMHIFSFDKSGKSLVYGYPHGPHRPIHYFLCTWHGCLPVVGACCNLAFQLLVHESRQF
jgi:hypothetical protein